MSSRRFTRLTNGFSKRVENLKAAVALHFAHYDSCRVHSTIKTTLALAAGWWRIGAGRSATLWSFRIEPFDVSLLALRPNHFLSLEQ